MGISLVAILRGKLPTYLYPNGFGNNLSRKTATREIENFFTRNHPLSPFYAASYPLISTQMVLVTTYRVKRRQGNLKIFLRSDLAKNYTLLINYATDFRQKNFAA